MKWQQIALHLGRILKEDSRLPVLDNLTASPKVTNEGHIVWHDIPTDSPNHPVKLIERYPELAIKLDWVSDNNKAAADLLLRGISPYIRVRNWRRALEDSAQIEHRLQARRSK